MTSIIRAAAFAAVLCIAARAPGDDEFRPPAVPLVTHDPYFSIWSCSNLLSDAATRHWTGKSHAIGCLVRIDGRAYRAMGAEPADLAVLPQTDLEVLPTRTIYHFQTAELHLDLTFLTPALPHDLDVLSRPLTYLVWQAASADGKQHEVAIYFDAAAEIVVDAPEQQVTWAREKIKGLRALRIGSKFQPVLDRSGDDRRIDWGYLYVAAPDDTPGAGVVAEGTAARKQFVEKGALPTADDPRQPRAADDQSPAIAFLLDMKRVGPEPVQRHLLLAYDDLYSIEYFRRPLRAYWRRGGAEAADLLWAAQRDYPALSRRCAAFDEDLVADLQRCGGENYVRLCSLAYRQCLAGNKLVAAADGRPLLFPKENFSNGCIATVDVIYPMDPMFLLLSPALTKASLDPIFDYAEGGRWRFAYAPHDLGTYPKANGQVYGGKEKTETDQMPVEESSNMLLLTAALAKIEGNADYAARHWPLLKRWAEYLKKKGFDPARQLCTDDFAGHLAHNVNLSAKAIEALGAYGLLCQMRGQNAEAATCHKLAVEWASQWQARAADGDHYRLAFDKPGTWSQKYNLVWDRILGLNLFPAEVLAREVAFYRHHQKRYGLPLDSRADYTKLDWTVWSASLADSRADFDALIAPLAKFLNHTPNRVPMTDWYKVRTAKKRGFQARSVVGGLFIRMLCDEALWRKWAYEKDDKVAR